jgi:two-component system response regulator YesN
MNMRKLLIVDDENNIRYGLKVMIERQYPKMFEITLASDGAEALGQILDTGADIVITDIRMPGMDGIALINRINEIASKPKVIILSGYEEFHYAKEAIKNNVQEYLLKPIVREELFKALSRVEQELLRNEDISTKLEASNEYMVQLRASQLNYIIMNPHITPEEITIIATNIELQLFDQEFHIGLLKPIINDSRNMEMEQFLNHIELVLKDVGLDLAVNNVHFFDKDGNLVVISTNTEIFQYLSEHNEDKDFFRFSIAVSEKGCDIGNIKVGYLQAAEALKYSFLQVKPTSIRFANVKDRDRQYELPIDQIRKLYNVLGTDREKELKVMLLDILDIKKISHYDISYLEGIQRKLNELVFDRTFNIYGAESVQILTIYKKVGNLYNCRNFQDYYHDVESLLLRLSDYIKSIKSVHADHKEMKKAVQYMYDNYHKDLDMAVVSNYVSLNYSYFSQSFKEYTGESFVTFLKRIRINKAKDLLEHTENKVFEVGKMVGYTNPKQFNRTFRELEGITPIEYRNRM